MNTLFPAELCNTIAKKEKKTKTRTTHEDQRRKRFTYIGPPLGAYHNPNANHNMNWRMGRNQPLMITAPTWKMNPPWFQNQTFPGAWKPVGLPDRMFPRNGLNPNAASFFPRMIQPPPRPTQNRRLTMDVDKHQPQELRNENLRVQVPPPPPQHMDPMKVTQQGSPIDPQITRRKVSFELPYMEKSPLARPFMLPPCSRACAQLQQEGKLEVAKQKNREWAEKILDIEKDHNIAMNLFKERTEMDSKKRINAIYNQTDHTVADLERKIQQLHIMIDDLKGQKDALVERCEILRQNNLASMNMASQMSVKNRNQADQLNNQKRAQNDLVREINWQKNAFTKYENKLRIIEMKNKELVAEKKDLEDNLDKFLQDWKKDKENHATIIKTMEDQMKETNDNQVQSRIGYDNTLEEMNNKEKAIREECENLKKKVEELQEFANKQLEQITNMSRNRSLEEKCRKEMIHEIDDLTGELVFLRKENSSLRSQKLQGLNSDMKFILDETFTKSDPELSPYEEESNDADGILNLDSEMENGSDSGIETDIDDNGLEQVIKYLEQDTDDEIDELNKDLEIDIIYYFEDKEGTPPLRLILNKCVSDHMHSTKDKNQIEIEKVKNQPPENLIEFSSSANESSPDSKIQQKKPTKSKIKEKKTKVCTSKMLTAWIITMMTFIILAHVGLAKAETMNDETDTEEEIENFNKKAFCFIKIITCLLSATLTSLIMIFILTVIITCFIKKIMNQRSNKMMNYILVFLALVAVAAGDATPKDNSTIIRQGIVFEKKGLALVNAPLVKFQKKYKPCDVIILKSRFEKLMLQYENLCKTKIQEEYENADIVEKTVDDYVLLRQNMTLPQARYACAALDSNIISVRTKAQALDLSKFMHLNDLKYVFAGLRWDEDTSEIIFSDTKSLASDEVFRDIYDTYERHQVSWQTAHETAVRTPQGVHYTYKRVDKTENEIGLALMLWRENLIKGTLDRGIARRERVICQKPMKSTRSLTRIGQWRDQCNQKLLRLQLISLQLDSKIESILPQNQKTTTSPLVPVMTFIEDSPFGTLFQEDNTPKNKTEKDLKAILVNDNIPLDEMCTAVVNYLKKSYDYEEGTANVENGNNRKKRETDDLTRVKRGVGAIASFGLIFNLVEFLAKTAFAGVRFMNWKKKNNWKNSGGKGSDVLYLMVKQNDYNEQLDIAMQFMAVAGRETELKEELDIIAEYVDEATAKLSAIINNKSYRPSAHEYISEKGYDNIKQQMRHIYKVEIPESLRFVKASITIEKDAFLVEFMIPLNPKEYLCDLYQLHPLGRFTDNRRYEQDLNVEYVAISTRDDRMFTTLDKSELINCMKQEFCTATHPATKKVNNTCGLCSYFGEGGDCCRYINPHDPFQPRFLTIGTKIFYVIDHDKELNLTIRCINEVRSSLEQPEQMVLTGTGHFKLNIGCEARTPGNEIIVRPSIDTKQAGTNLQQQPSKQNEQRYELFEEEVPKWNLDFDIKVLSEKRTFEKYVKPGLIITSTLGGLIVLIAPAIAIWLKCAGGPKLISCFTNIKPNEVEKIMKVRGLKKAIRLALREKDSEDEDEDEIQEGSYNTRFPVLFPPQSPPLPQPMENFHQHFREREQLDQTLRRLNELATFNSHTDVEDARTMESAATPPYCLHDPLFNSTMQTTQGFTDEDAIGAETVESRKIKLMEQRNKKLNRTTQSMPQISKKNKLGTTV